MTDNHSLHELIKMIGNGDPMAFDTLYMKMHVPVPNQDTEILSSTINIQ